MFVFHALLMLTIGLTGFSSEYIDEEGVRWTRERTKPTMSIMSDYSVNWKPRYNHFQRHNDVRPKG